MKKDENKPAEVFTPGVQAGEYESASAAAVEQETKELNSLGEYSDAPKPDSVER